MSSLKEKSKDSAAAMKPKEFCAQIDKSGKQPRSPSRPQQTTGDDLQLANLNSDEFPVVLYELNENAASAIYSENYEKASTMLEKARQVLDQLCLGNYRGNVPISILTFHNLALTYQKLGMLRECGDALRQCLELARVLATGKDAGENKLKNLKYISKLHMQYCAILSQQNKHREALDHAKYGVKYTHLCLHETIKIAEAFASRHLNEAHPPANASPSLGKRLDASIPGDFSVSSMPDASLALAPIIEGLAVRLLPILNEMRARCVVESQIPQRGHLKSQSAQPNTWSWRKYRHATQQQQSQPHQQPRLGERLDIRNLFGYLQSSEWVANLNIGNLMQVSPMTLQDLLVSYDKELELSRESLLEKAALLSVAYFCISTERRFLAQETGGKEGPDGRQSEFWHGKALELACCFLPADCPLVAHIFSSYQKHHSVLQQPIMEDVGMTDNIKVIKPLNGSRGLSFQPIVRAEVRYEMTPPANKDFEISFSPPTTRASTVSKAKASKNQILAMIYANPRSPFRPRMNEGMIESAKRARQGRKHTPDASLIMSQISIDGEGPQPPLRPKSSQSFCAKVAPGSTSSAGVKPPQREKAHNLSHMGQDNDVGGVNANSNGEMELSRSMYQYNTANAGNKPTPKRCQAIKRPIRVKRPLVQLTVPAGGGMNKIAGFPKELEMIHKVVIRGHITGPSTAAGKSSEKSKVFLQSQLDD